MYKVTAWMNETLLVIPVMKKKGRFSIHGLRDEVRIRVSFMRFLSLDLARPSTP